MRLIASLGLTTLPTYGRVKKMHHSQTVHLTQKPVELAVRAIQYSSQRGENVLELFAGSGTTLIACEQTERRCFRHGDRPALLRRNREALGGFYGPESGAN